MTVAVDGEFPVFVGQKNSLDWHNVRKKLCANQVQMLQKNGQKIDEPTIHQGLPKKFLSNRATSWNDIWSPADSDSEHYIQKRNWKVWKVSWHHLSFQSTANIWIIGQKELFSKAVLVGVPLLIICDEALRDSVHLHSQFISQILGKTSLSARGKEENCCFQILTLVAGISLHLHVLLFFPHVPCCCLRFRCQNPAIFSDLLSAMTLKEEKTGCRWCLVGTNFCPKKWVTFFTPNFVAHHITRKTRTSEPFPQDLDYRAAPWTGTLVLCN